MEFCVVFVVVLALVTVVGHLIWLALAAMARAVSGGEAVRNERRPRWEECPACDAPVSPGRLHCPSCGLDLDSARAARLRDIDATRRALRDLLEAEELDHGTVNRLNVVLTRRRAWAIGRRPREAAEHVPEVVVRSAPVAQDYPEVIPVLDALPVDEPTPAAVAAPVVVAPAPQPAPPRRPLTEVLAGFMESRNILWGELVGGLLIVGCSIALVLTLWGSLQELPYFPFLLFSGITAALFGAGYYTLHHWKLETTSRGLLVIAALLAPLNLLVLADPSARGGLDANGWIHLLVAAASLTFFGWMIWSAGRDLIGAHLLPGPIDRRWLLALAVTGTAGTQLLTPALFPEFDDLVPFGKLLALAFVPGACYLLATGAVLGGLTLYRKQDELQRTEDRGQRTEPRPPSPASDSQAQMSAGQAHALFSFLGLGVFALLVALAFLMTRDSHRLAILPALALPIALAGVPGLAGGLIVRHMLPAEDAGNRTAGTAVTLAGLGLMLAGLAVAWPQPWPLLLVAAVNAVALTAAAYRGRASFLHGGALPCLALAALLAVRLAGAPLPEEVTAGWLLGELGSVASGLTLALLVAGIAAVAVTLDRHGMTDHARDHALVGVCLTLPALLIATSHGMEHPWAAACVHGLLALTALACCAHKPRHWLAQPGAWMILPASLWALQAALPGQHLAWATVVAGEGLILLILASEWADRAHPVRIALQSAGAAAGVLALGLMVVEPPPAITPLHAASLALVAAQAFLLAGQVRLSALSYLGSLLALGALLALWELSPPGLFPRPAAALLAHAALGLAVARLVRTRDGGTFANPLEVTAAATSLLAAVSAAWPGDHLPWRAAYMLCAAGLWLDLAWRHRSPAWFALVQAGTSAALLLALRTLIEARGWYGSPSASDPRVLQLYAAALALLGLLWVALRRVDASAGLWPKYAASADQFLTVGMVVGNAAMLAIHVAPGSLAEWYPWVRLDEFGWWTPATFGPAGWLCVTSLAVLLLAGLRRPAGASEEGFRVLSLGGLVLLAASAVMLWSGEFSEERATASALRWGLAVLFVVGSAALWWREHLARQAWGAGFALGGVPPAEDLTLPFWRDSLVRALLSLCGFVVFLYSAIAAVIALAGKAAGGPVPGSLFARMDPRISSLVPLVLLAAGLWGSALRERSAIYAWLACQLVTLSALAGYALSLPELTQADALFLWLLAAQTAAVGALCWLAARRIPSGSLLHMQAWAGLAAVAALALFPFAWWMTHPEGSFLEGHRQLGRWPGWLSLALALAAAMLHARRHAPAWAAGGIAAAVLLCGVLAGCAAAPVDVENAWVGYHTMALTWAGLTALLFAAGFLVKREAWRWPDQAAGWMSVIAAALIAAALRGRDAPWQPWVPAAAALAAALAFAAPALWFRWGIFSHLSGACILLAGWVCHEAIGGPSPAGFWLTLGLSLALASALWSLPRPRDEVRFSLLAAPLAAAIAAGVVWLTGGDGVADFPMRLGWITAIAVGVALYLERRSFVALPGSYVLLLTAIGLGLLGLGLGAWYRPAATGLALALHVGLCAGIAARFSATAQREWQWFFPVHLLMMASVAALAVAACLSPEALGERLTGPSMLLSLVPAAWLLTETTPSLSLRLRWLSPLALAATVASLALALPSEASFAGHAKFMQAIWLERSAWMLLAFAATAVAYLEWPAAWGELREPAHGVGQILFAASLLLALAVLAQMMPLFDPDTRRTPLTAPAVLAVFAALACLFVTSLRHALITGREPLGLSASGRQLYVYLAELLLLLLFANARLNVPEMFTGALAKYWTVVVMVIAFLGVGLSELFGRRGLAILSVPLQRTAMLLPLVPLLAFWARPPMAAVEFAREQAPGMVPFLERLTQLPWNFRAHALIWFLAGGLYLVLALTNRSTRWAMTAALAANFGLWAVWMAEDVGFAHHPQFWLIPLGIILLVTEHLERRNLSDEVSSGLRYLGICVIYVASSAELFITGLGNSLWLPVLLAVLCVAGVLAGIWLRVKAFLFLGVSFLLLDIGAMIWHAAVDRGHAWIWWASGIVLGVAILALFALFEKKRNEVVKVVGDLKRWD